MTNTNIILNGFTVLDSGMLTLIQDLGRFGQANLGLTNGGPADRDAFNWANRLLGNSVNDAMLEVTYGGVKLKANLDTAICVTGAKLPLVINGANSKLWCVHKIKAGDVIELGMPTEGVRSYIAVLGGIQVEKQFGSCATVVREQVGGLVGDKLKVGDALPLVAAPYFPKQRLYLAGEGIPKYNTTITLNVVLGYQQHHFSQLQKRRFFCSEYQVSKQWDRMGYRLQGPVIKMQQTSMLSEGIALGAIQLPPDGQPIVLMYDRQTIGGYPKIGSVLSLDLAKLAQCGQGAKVHFRPMTIEQAHNELHLAKYRYDNTAIKVMDW